MTPLTADLGAADLAVLERAADPNVLVKLGVKRLTTLITKTSHHQQGVDRAEQWIAAGQASIELYGGHSAVAFTDLADEVATEVRLLRAVQVELAAHARTTRDRLPAGRPDRAGAQPARCRRRRRPRPRCCDGRPVTVRSRQTVPVLHRAGPARV